MNQFSVCSTPVFVASEIRETFKVAILKHTPLGKLTCVDGSEIRRSPVVGSLSHSLSRILKIPGGCMGFLPSTVSPAQ